MNGNRSVLLVLTALAIAGCEGGGVDIGVETVDNSVDNSTNGGGGGGGNNPCASYTVANSNEVRIGTFDGTNCVYSGGFVGKTNPLLVNLTIPFISGVHIFQDSLFVGEDVETGAAPAAGEGPTLTIAAGNQLAFSNSADYVLINRGSQIFAEGSPTAPIVFTAFSDAVSDTAGANDVSLWGGIVINGNGITNNCNDAERAADQCHVVSEGQPSHYGGDDNEENSGVLRYVIVKHTGFEVAPNDELNGITFNAVGSGTTVENIEAYSTYDDGFEFFGGAVNVSKAIVLYARDDSLDFSDGYAGTISEALIIHYRTDGNRCIEGDNIAEARGSAEPLDTQPQSNPTIRNLTCITSNGDQSAGQGTHGDSEGALARFGARMHIEDSIFFSGYGFVESGGSLTSNECLEFENATSAVTSVADISNALAAAGASTMEGSLIACEEPVTDTAANGDNFSEWVLGANPSTNGANYSFNTGNAIISTAPNAASVLEPESFYTASSFTDDLGGPVTVTPVTPDVDTDTCDDCPKVGAVLADGDWTTPWAFGLRDGNADEPLWITVPPAP
jgi:hypothetical protein